uniref:Uncharacterized protein n=1 Tax=Amphimedon queenslandica TaxID=400682 RepID=A0A1X7SFU9_AMPQE
MIHKDNTPRNFWKLGRIDDTITGKDRIVQGAQVEVHCKDGQTKILKQSIAIIPMEIESQVISISHTGCQSISDSHTQSLVILNFHTGSQAISDSHTGFQVIWDSHTGSQVISDSHTRSQVISESHTGS